MKTRLFLFIPAALCAVAAVVITYSVLNAHASEMVSTSLMSETSSSLKAYYQLESDGTDHQGNYNLTLYNSPSFGTAKYGNGIDLGSSNTNKYANVNSNLGITNGAISMSLWVKLNSEISGDGVAWGLAHKGDASTNVEYFISYSISSGVRQVRFFRIKQMNSQAEIDVPITLGTSAWHHVVLTYDGTTLYGYVDGAKTSGVAASGDGSSASDNNFTIGAQENYGNGYNLASAMFDDVAVFNRALTDAEVFALGGLKTSAHRTSDRSISSSTTVQSDDQLAITLAANKTYAIEGIVFAESTNAAPGIKFDFSSASVSSLAVGYSAVNNTLQSGGMLTAVGSTVSVPATAGAVIPIRFAGTVTMSQTGSLTFQWAQNVSSSDAMTVMAGSYIRASEIE